MTTISLKGDNQNLFIAVVTALFDTHFAFTGFCMNTSM